MQAGYCPERESEDALVGLDRRSPAASFVTPTLRFSLPNCSDMHTLYAGGCSLG